MPHRRQRSRGSFASHFDDLVVNFPDRPHAPRRNESSTKRSADLQEKVDIHALLFEWAWRLDDQL